MRTSLLPFYTTVAISAPLLVLLMYTCGNDTRSIWLKEAYSWRLSQCPLLDTITLTWHSRSAPLYFVALGAWSSAFGDSVFAMRFLSGLAIVLQVASTTCVAVIAYPRGSTTRAAPSAARRGVFVAATAFVLLSLCAVEFRFAQEVRELALASVFLVSGSVLLFAALLWGGHAVAKWLSFSALRVAAIYTHDATSAFIFAESLYIAFYLPRCTRSSDATTRLANPLRAARWSYVAIGVLAVPRLGPLFVRSVAAVQGVSDAPLEAVSTAILAPVRLWLLTPTPTHDWLLVLAIGLLAIGFCLWLLSQRDMLLTYLAVMTFMPYLAFCLASPFFSRKSLEDQVLLYALPYFILGIAVFIDRIEYRAIRYAVLSIVVLTNAVVFCWVVSELDASATPGLREAAAIIEDNAQPAERVVAWSPSVYLPLTYYIRGRLPAYLTERHRTTPELIVVEPHELVGEALLSKAGGVPGFWLVTMPARDSYAVAIAPTWTLTASHTIHERLSTYGNGGMIQTLVFVDHYVATRLDGTAQIAGVKE